MLKVLSVLAVLALTACPGQADTHTNKARQAESTAQPPAPILPVGAQQNDSNNLKSESGQSVKADVRVVSTPEKDVYDHAAFWANIALVVVGIGGIGVAIATLLKIKNQAEEMELQRKAMEDTLIAIKRQADEMERQTAIQEANISQWVDIEVVRGREGVGGRDAFGELPQLMPVEIHFKAVNNTPYPFTVNRIELKISRYTGFEGRRWEEFETSPQVTLPPSREGKESSHEFMFMLYLEGAAIKTYIESKFLMAFNGRVFFTSAAGPGKRQLV